MKVLIGIALGTLLAQATCYRNYEPDIEMGQSIASDLIVVFKPGTTLEERRRFDETSIGKQVPGSEGYGLMDGIKAELALPMICPNQDGIALKMRDDVTTEQLNAIRAAINASPIVDKVFEKTVPSEVRCKSQ